MIARYLLRMAMLFAVGLLLTPTALAQDIEGQIERFLQQHAGQLKLPASDVAEWEITDRSVSRRSGVTHVYIRQRYQGIPIFNGVANFAIKDGEIRHHGLRLQTQLAARANTTTFTLSPAEAIRAAARQLGLPAPRALPVQSSQGPHQVTFSNGGISLEDIPVQLMYQPLPEGELKLVWDLCIYPHDGDHWWSVRIDAQSGELLHQVDWVTHCTFVEHPYSHHAHESYGAAKASAAAATLTNGGQYRVFPIEVESPNHGPRSLEIDPADSLASPFGWHDTDGTVGAEFTITRGNNVLASDDADADNLPGYSPDGGASLIFDFPFDPNQGVSANQDAAITNLFYYNNMMHDVWYHYGFDEVSGNFQENNYGRGGLGGDFVNADAQDGGGLNNANFGTPPDGSQPRMQMFLWQTGGSTLANLLTVDSPGSIAGAYAASEASFGPGLPATPLTAELILADDGAAPNPNDACSPLNNAAAIAGKVALLDRGNCLFVEKVQAAQDAGAVAVIVVNDAPGPPITMGGTPTSPITIPSIMVSQSDGNLLKGALNNGTVVVTLQDQGIAGQRDGSFDNGIVAHEYTHGITNRLAGGPTNAGCLFNAEQMGEGWSDWYAMMMDFDPNRRDRGIGTFAVDQPTNGIGIRNARYSYDLNVNPFTYGDVNNGSVLSQPHGIGFVWCTMLWDLTLVMVDSFGYDPDLIHGTGGNNLMMELVTEALKLQSCNPGFVDGRDAILAADSLLYGGAYQCLIWEVFARRGLGASASQGNSDDRSDQVEAFDIPLSCQTPTVAPVAAFNLGSNRGCGNTARFQDQSTDVPQSWFWDFGDGNTSTERNPIHVYTGSGSYLVTQVATNALGADTSFQIVNITLPAGPQVDSLTVCGEQSVLLAPQDSGIFVWYDGSGNLIDTLDNLATGTLTGDTTFFVEEIIPAAIENVGPLDGISTGGGGYHNTGFTGTVNFEALEPFTLLSVWVDAGSAGSRTFFLHEGPNATGNVIAQVTVNLSAGPQRVALDLDIPDAGLYSLAGTTVDLYRNNAGVNYPYEIPDLVRLVGSSAGGDFYYYFYDWEVQGQSCRSDRIPASVGVQSALFSFAQDSSTATFTFTNQSTGGSQYEWDFGDGNTSTQPNPVHVYAVPDTYVVSLTIDGNCSYVDTVVAVRTTGLAELQPGLQVVLQPNPAQGRVQLTFSQALTQAVALELLSASGQTLRRAQLTMGLTEHWIDLEQLPSGVYLVQLTQGQTRQTLRLMVAP